MINNRSIYLSLFLLSASVLCFEIVSTRVTSVIFVNDYAFIILSLAILGLSCGAIFSYYKIKSAETTDIFLIIQRLLIFISASLCLYIVLVTELSITNPFPYFLLLFVPFFIAGIIYAQLFRIYAGFGFSLYASDLTGAAAGSIASIGLLGFFGASNGILFIAAVVLGSAGIYFRDRFGKKRVLGFYLILLIPVLYLIHNGDKEILRRVPIGYFPEKDFYHVYDGLNVQSRIVESRWSVYGRSDLVQHSHQDIVKHLFIDGAAGTQMYRFNRDAKKPGALLLNLLLRHSNSIPFLLLRPDEKNNMLIIGPGGGKDILIGLFGGVEKITGVEINPDFVNIVKDQKEFNGGIYTDFPNVEILVREGRQFIRQSEEKYDVIMMALPSTEQLQNIEAFAMSENYLVTREAIQDYLKILNPEGSLIFTVHNDWELMRMITTAVSAFESIGVSRKDAIDHFALLESEYAPTIVIKKNAFTVEDVRHWKDIIQKIPKELPAVTFLPHSWEQTAQSDANSLLQAIFQDGENLQNYIDEYKYEISPCVDDSPYFYKIKKGVPVENLWLMAGIAVFGLIIIILPLRFIRKNITGDKVRFLSLALILFICIGLGFMMLEVSLFQKLVLYLGAPTISLAILLSSLLVGMGTGSYFGGRIFGTNASKRIYLSGIYIVLTGTGLFIICPYILFKLLSYSLVIRSAASFVTILPFGFLLGILFPSGIKLLKEENLGKYIPWMYGINGAMSVLGSVLAVVLSIAFGFTYAFFVGLSLYLLLSATFYFSLNHSRNT